MALIKCKECNKEVSDTAKTCPHCGYKLKSFKLNLKVKNTDLIVLGFIIQVFLLMFVNGTFAREFHSWGDKIVTRISNASFIDATYALCSITIPDVIIIFLGIIAIATILVKIFNKYDLKVLNKIKNNIYVCNVPTIIYAVIILLITLCSELALGVVEGYESKFWYSVRWGGIWMNILSIVAASILVRELVIHIKNKKVREKMKNKILLIVVAIAMLFTITGCGKLAEQKEQDKEVNLNSAYILDYENKNYLGSENQAYMIVVFNINPKKDILLDNVSMTMKVGDNTITGSKYDNETRADIIYDSYNNIKSGDSGKLAYIFKMEKYLYKENDTFSINYKVGTQKGEYSYIIEDTLSYKKEKIEQVDYLEDIVKGVYKDNADDALMILSLKWKINDVYAKAEAYDKYIKNDIYTWSNHQCYSKGARENGNKILDYFTEGAENNISISNRGFLNVGVKSPEKTYELPALNYDTLEKYYPGIKEPLTELSNKTNEYANGLINVKESGNGTCYRDMYITDIRSKAKAVDAILKK